MLLGIAMVMVLFENQRNAVQENTLALSTLGVDPRRLLFADDLVPSMQAALERLMSALPMRRAAIFITERWRGLLPSVQHGFLGGVSRRAGKNAAPAITSANWPTGRAESLPCTIWRRWPSLSQSVAGRNLRGIQADFSPTRKSAI